MNIKGRQINTITVQRILLTLIGLAGILGFFLVPGDWQSPIGNVLITVVFGAVLLDWIWLRFINPNAERRDGGNRSDSGGQP
jgi:hypothetical protein